jgi:hypothetical protein
MSSAVGRLPLTESVESVCRREVALLTLRLILDGNSARYPPPINAAQQMQDSICHSLRVRRTGSPTPVALASAEPSHGIQGGHSTEWVAGRGVPLQAHPRHHYGILRRRVWASGRVTRTSPPNCSIQIEIVKRVCRGSGEAKSVRSHSLISGTTLTYALRILMATKLMRDCLSTGNASTVEELKDLVKDLVLS